MVCVWKLWFSAFQLIHYGFCSFISSFLIAKKNYNLFQNLENGVTSLLHWQGHISKVKLRKSTKWPLIGLGVRYFYFMVCNQVYSLLKAKKVLHLNVNQLFKCLQIARGGQATIFSGVSILGLSSRIMEFYLCQFCSWGGPLS